MGTTTYAPATPAVLTAVSQLTEDYLLTAEVLVTLAVATPLCIFPNSGGLSELLTIDSSGNLNHVYRDPTSDSGWNVRTAVASCSPSAVVAGADPQGVLHAFYIGASNEVYHISLSGTTWSSPTDLSCAAESLNITQQPNSDGGIAALVPYGVATSGDILILNQSSSSWTAQTYTDTLQGVTCQLQTSKPGGVWIMFAVIDGAAQWNPFSTDLTKTLGWGGLKNAEWGDGSYGPWPSGLTELVLAPTADVLLFGNQLLFFLDTQKNLWSAVVYLGLAQFTQVTNSSCASLSVTQQAADNTMAQVYMTDTKNNLWVIRQSSWDDSNGGLFPTSDWYDPVPLGDELMQTYTPPGANDQAALYALDPTGALWTLWQDPVTTSWSKVQVQQPTAEPAHISTYRTTLTLVDANSTVMPNQELSISASAATLVWVEGVAYPVSTSQSVTVYTNYLGQLSVVSPAFGLGTPSLTFSNTSLGVQLSVSPPQDVQQYLAGTGTLNNLQTFNGTALLNATGADGTALAPGLTSTGADAAASGIQALFNLPAAGLGATPDALFSSGHSGHAGFGMDFSDRHSPTFRLMTQAEVETYRANTSNLLGDVWDDIAKFIGDAWHGIENAAIQLEKFVVDTALSVFHMTLSIAGELSNDIPIPIHDIDDVVNMVHSVFSSISADLSRVLEWLRSLFSWTDILNTQQVLQHYLTSAIPFLQNLISTQAKPLVNGFFSNLESEIQAKISDMQTNVGTGTSLSSMPQFGQPANALTGAASGSNPPNLWSTPQHTWIFDKARQYSGSATGLDPTATSDLTKDFTSLSSSVATAVSEFQKSLTDLENFFTGAISQPSDFKTLAVTDLLGAVANVIAGALSFADGIIEDLLSLVTDALSSFQSFLTGSVNIPLLTSLWQTIADEDLTVAGLLSLIGAVPLTIGYKLANSNNAPFTSTQVQQILASAPTTNAVSAGAGTGAGTRLAPTADVDPAVATAFKFMAAGIQLIWAVFDTCLDAVNLEEGPLDKILSSVDVGWPVLEQMMSWPSPSGVPFDIPQTPASQQWNFGMWCCYWVPPVLDAALLFVPAPGESSALGNTLIRYSDPAGKIAASVIGMVTLGVSNVASILGGLDHSMDAGTIAANVLGPISYIGQPLRTESLIDSSEGLSQAIQLLNDFFTGVGCAVAMFAS